MLSGEGTEECVSSLHGDERTMSAMVKLSKEVDEPPDVGQPTGECQLIWLPGGSWLDKVDGTSVEEGHDVGRVTVDARTDDVSCGEAFAGDRRVGVPGPLSPRPTDCGMPVDGVLQETAGYKPVKTFVTRCGCLMC